MATAKINTSRFLAKGGTDATARVGSVAVALPSGSKSSEYMPTGKSTGGTVGGRISGLASNAKVRNS